MKNLQEGSRKPSAAFISPCALKVHSCWTRKIPLRCPVPYGLGVDAGGREGARWEGSGGGSTSRDLRLDLSVSSRMAQISPRTPPPVCCLKELSFTYVVDALGEFVCGDVYVFFFLI